MAWRPQPAHLEPQAASSRIRASRLAPSPWLEKQRSNHCFSSSAQRGSANALLAKAALQPNALRRFITVGDGASVIGAAVYVQLPRPTPDCLHLLRGVQRRTLHATGNAPAYCACGPSLASAAFSLMVESAANFL